jgi:hypothetical protein
MLSSEDLILVQHAHRLASEVDGHLERIRKQLAEFPPWVSPGFDLSPMEHFDRELKAFDRHDATKLLIRDLSEELMDAIDASAKARSIGASAALGRRELHTFLNEDKRPVMPAVPSNWWKMVEAHLSELST